MIAGMQMAVACQGGDPYYQYVTGLIDGEGADSGTTFTDAKGHTVTRIGSTVTSTSQVKYGTSSIKFDGDDALSMPTGVDFQFGTGDYTIECWIHMASRNSVQSVFSLSNSSGTSGIIMQIGSGGLTTATKAGAGIGSGNVAVPLTTWTHVAFSRTSGTLTQWVGGVQAASHADSSNITDGVCFIGQFSAGSQMLPANTYMRDARITKGFGRYTAAFTPPGPAPKGY